ncbi:hypothetical protein CKO51_12725 [Rhodopirellula sp. SM50]|nr:hypothetical protein CKO51_12725 [Rhodopirellula sp. SM50]
MTQDRNETSTAGSGDAAQYQKAKTVQSATSASTISMSQEVRVAVTRQNEGTVKLRYTPDPVQSDPTKIDTL